jgi:CHAT domain
VSQPSFRPSPESQQIDVLNLSPLYAVLFDAGSDAVTTQEPVVSGPFDLAVSEEFTVPHGLDRRLANVLPGLWYSLHLPNTFRDLIDIPARALKARQVLHLDHHILLTSIQAFNRESIPVWAPWTVPAMIFCSDGLVSEANMQAATMGFPFPAVGFSELSEESLKSHWRAIYDHFISGPDYLGREPLLARRLDLAPIDLPRRLSARQWTDESSVLEPRIASPEELVDMVLHSQVVFAAISRLESEGATRQVAAQKLPATMREERDTFRFPVTIALPGVAPAYIREVFPPSLRRGIQPISRTDINDTWSLTIQDRPDREIERAAIEFVTTHRAIARSGAGLMMGTVPPQGFVALAQIERHFIDGPNGRKVWRLLDRLNRETESILDDAALDVISRASMLTVFSNFPIGLLRLPGVDGYLGNLVPIAYRPLIPLTRTVQHELTDTPPIGLGRNFKVLVAEAIPREDVVGQYSRGGWKFVEDMLHQEGPEIAIKTVETLSIDALRTAISDHKPDILVISAHGHLDQASNVAGLVIGNQFYLGPEIDSLPPVVILSACHVAPRGAGVVSITDLMLRQGAVAVLGTQVPVDVQHNSLLMMRFFLYMAEVLAGRESYSNLLEIWHHVQVSNAVHDILAGNPQIQDWGSSEGPSGVPVIAEFTQQRAPGRLRRSNVYRDSEDLLAEIADEQGLGARVRNWFRSPGYVPESLFYIFAGRPERIYLRSMDEVASEFASGKYH